VTEEQRVEVAGLAAQPVPDPSTWRVQLVEPIS
jgi:hypothetical protein